MSTLSRLSADPDIGQLSRFGVAGQITRFGVAPGGHLSNQAAKQIGGSVSVLPSLTSHSV
jgi:hypothetical protein